MKHPNQKKAVAGVETERLVYALDRVAVVFESADPHVRAESKRIAKNRLEDITNEIPNEEASA